MYIFTYIRIYPIYSCVPRSNFRCITQQCMNISLPFTLILSRYISSYHVESSELPLSLPSEIYVTGFSCNKPQTYMGILFLTLCTFSFKILFQLLRNVVKRLMGYCKFFHWQLTAKVHDDTKRKIALTFILLTQREEKTSSETEHSWIYHLLISKKSIQKESSDVWDPER